MKKLLTGIALGITLMLVLAATNLPQSWTWDSVSNSFKVLMKDGGGTKSVPTFTEGTWTPAINTTTNLTGTPTFTKARWAKFGNFVHFTVYTTGLFFSATNTGTRLVITSTGLPRPASNDYSVGVCEGYRGGTDFVPFSISMQSSGTIVMSTHSGSQTGSVDIGCSMTFYSAWQ